MRKSIRLTTICTCVVVFFVSLILSLSFLITPAKADTKSVFQMEYGASVKLSKNGLRFKAKMSKDYYDMLVTNDPNDDVLLYGYIAPIEVLDSMTEYSDFIAGGKRVGGELDQSKIYQGEDGYYYANIVMTNLDTYDYQDKSFSAIIFIEDNSGSSPVYTYAELALDEEGHINVEAQNRLQYDVVNAAFLDGEKSYESKLIDTYGSWYGTEEYPIFVNTATEYQSFVSKLGDAEFKAKIEGKHVFVKEGVQGDITSVVSVTKISGHTVRFWNGNKVVDTQFIENGADATVPAEPTKDGYEFVEWNGNLENIQADTDVYAKWKVAKGDVKDLGNISVYGVTRADGSALESDADVLGKKVVLLSGDLGDGAYYPNETDSKNDPTDENNTADQAYLAYDGQYGFNDYFVADFTGKNMPTLAFFANNYNNSIFYGDGTKNGVVVSTGLTWPNGLLFTEPNAYCTSVFNGKGLCMWGPHMIYSTAKNNNDTSKGVLLHPNVDNVAIARENLVSGKHYRVIMGFQPGDDPSNMAIKLVYVLYDLDNDCIVESREENTYNFFADGWANAGQTRDAFCLGSIVAYGYFGTTTVLDKTYAIYEDTTIGEISRGFGMKTQSNTTANGDSIVLGASGIGDGANYTLGQNNGGYVNQSYYALNGDYNLNDYVAFDFTGKNMPEIAFFAKNYNNSMYAEGTSKQGIVVVTGITTYDGQLGSGVNSNGTQINYGFPYMIQDATSGAFVEGSFANSALGRANLVDGTHYRVIMGFTEHAESARITLKWCLYNLDTNTVVEEGSMSSWGFFTGSNAQAGNMTRDQLSGSIVLYGKFGVTCTIDKLYGVYEDTNISKIMTALAMNLKTVTFKNYDGTPLQEMQISAGETPVFSGKTPYKPGDAVFSSYEFAGWDKQLTAVTDDVTYTAVFTGTARQNVTLSGGSSHTYGVEQSNNKIVLKASGIGDGANYTLGQNNGGYVHQSYLALDGNYALNDYVAFDFTGKNLPEIAFFAKNYNDSMYAEGTSKQGIVVVTGITTWDGQLGSGVNGDGTQINYGFPYMIQNTGDGGFVDGAFANSALGRANLVDGTHYRVIMGFTGSGSAITLNWYLYNLDAKAVVEQGSMTTWNFFTGSNAQVGNMTIKDLSGSIVLYGKFGVACTLDKVHGVFRNTDIATVASGLNEGTTYTVTFEDSDGNVWQKESLAYGAMPEYKGETPIKASDRLFDYTFSGWDKSITQVTGNVTYTAVFEGTDKEGITTYNTTNAGSIVLGKGDIGGDGASIETGAGNGYVDQAYLALDGSYGLNDYVALDFTGKNMPEVAFFANNYDNSMYAGNHANGNQKTGIVVVTGITAWDGTASWVNGNSTQINYGFPYMIQNAADGGFCQGAFANSALGRANLVDNTHYRVIMGFTGSDSAITLNWCLYNLDTKAVVEKSSMTTWGFFSGSNAQVGNMILDDLFGSIVLYGKFGTTCTIDNLYEVFEDTTLDGVMESIIVTDGEGSGEGEPSEPTSTAPDYSKYNDQFDFYAYSCYSDGTYEIDGQKYYVGKNLANLKQYAMYGDVGMTIYFPQNDMLINGTAESIANAKALIDDLAKVGIKKTILQDNRILLLSMSETAIVGSGCQFADNDALDAYIYDCVKDYATYPGVYGVQLGDEPKYACLSAYAAVYNSLKRVNAKYGFNLFIQYNLNPLNVTQNVYDNYYPATSGTYEWNHLYYKLKVRDRFTDCVTRYTQYINDFLDAMNPDSIMYDDYPIREDKNGNKIILDSYIPCLQIVAKAAADRGIKFYHITQTHENNADGEVHKREVTEAGAKWLNNILIGFGAKQLAYYTYYTRSESDSTGGESYVDGQSFVDYNGNPTPLYGWMKEILANNQKFAPTVLQFDYKGSKTYGSADHLAEVTVGDSFAKLSSFAVNTGSALVTELYDDENNNYMYMAMNVLDPDATSTVETVTMTFNGYTNVLVYDGNGNFTTVALTNGVYTAKLTNGEAVYVIPYN